MNLLLPFLGWVLVVVCTITLKNFHQTANHHISENGSICSHHHENLMSCTEKKIFVDPLNLWSWRHFVPSNSWRILAQQHRVMSQLASVDNKINLETSNVTLHFLLPLPASVLILCAPKNKSLGVEIWRSGDAVFWAAWPIH